MRESICFCSCTGKYHLALVFRDSILFTIKSPWRHRRCSLGVARSCARVYFPRVDVWATREGSARGRCRGGWFSTGRELSFCRNKTRLSNQARAKLMGQQPLSPLWNARIYQRAEVALRAKDFPIVTGFSGAFSCTSAIFHSPCSLRAAHTGR